MQRDEIQAALAGDWTEARYQPIVGLRDRVPVAVEVLARLRHPSRGTLLPRHFVPHFEDAGFGFQLTDMIAARAFAELAVPALAPLRLDIALNFPLDVLLVADGPSLLDLRHRLWGIPATRVVIELTESRPVNDLPGLRAATTRLRDAGYQVMIDDIEPNVPQLASLIDLPFTGVKLDKALVQRLANDTEASGFVSRTVAAARSRGQIVTAEGVEDTATWNRLVEFGVDRAQGFLVARPMPAGSILGWVSRWSSRPQPG